MLSPAPTSSSTQIQTTMRTREELMTASPLWSPLQIVLFPHICLNYSAHSAGEAERQKAVKTENSTGQNVLDQDRKHVAIPTKMLFGENT